MGRNANYLYQSSYRQYRQGMDGRVYPSVQQCTHAHVDEEGKNAHMKKTDVCIDEKGTEARIIEEGTEAHINEETTEALSTRNSRMLISTISTRNGFDEEWSVEEGTHAARSISFVRQGREARRMLFSCITEIYVSIELRIYYSCSALINYVNINTPLLPHVSIQFRPMFCMSK